MARPDHQRRRAVEALRQTSGHAQRPAEVRVVYRKMKFDFETKGFERYWHGRSAFISCFWNAFSMSIPAGERFFLQAVNAVRHQVRDPRLCDEIAEFIRQEGHHSLQHRRFNRKVAEGGFDVARYEGRFTHALNWAADNLRPMQQLAVTVALEHFTAVLSREWLTNPALAEGADENVLALWLWHSAEEIEHKATCFDIYSHLGGRERTRLRASRSAWFLILFITFQNLFGMLRESGRLFDLREYVRGFWYLFGPRGLLTKMVPGLLAYLNEDFHPWETNDAGVLVAWQTENARYIEEGVTGANRGPSVA